MRVFVAGATGVIGRRLVPRLLEAGHQVTGMTRSPERADRLRALGAEAVACDVFDADRLIEAVGDAKPEAILHELTDIPRRFHARRYAAELAGNDRIRIEGTGNLVRAALETGIPRMVAQSISFVYAPRGGAVKREDDPLFLDAPPFLRPAVAAVQSLEQQVTSTPGLEGVVLRYGYFYGPGTSYAADGQIARLVRSRRFPIVGPGTGIYSFIHVDDAAAAAVAAVERAPDGIYNIVDDEPAAVREWLPAYAEALGAPRPRRVPVFMARRIGGPYVTYAMVAQRGASNEKARSAFDWTPAHPTWRTGFREALG